jgi:hypothetical protein
MNYSLAQNNQGSGATPARPREMVQEMLMTEPQLLLKGLAVMATEGCREPAEARRKPKDEMVRQLRRTE